MRKLILFLYLTIPLYVAGQPFRLAAPQISVDSVFFLNQAKISLGFDLDSAFILYTINGGYPDSRSPMYEKSLTIRESAVIRAKANHPDYLPGPFVEQELLQVRYRPDSTWLRTTPDSLYAGKGNATLFDLQKGGQDVKSGAWLGFRADTVVAEVFFKKKVKCKTLVVSTLLDVNAWIFPPAGIEVLGASGNDPWFYIGVWTARTDIDLRGSTSDYTQFRKMHLFPMEVDRIQVRVRPFGPLPAWHSGSGQPAWLFIDEIAFQ